MLPQENIKEKKKEKELLKLRGIFRDHRWQARNSFCFIED